ncbi:hypothetical protein N9L06_05770 [Mariniblastus sp.]|nr:hypothetical protein [Mariniblastus sp.]
MRKLQRQFVDSGKFQAVQRRNGINRHGFSYAEVLVCATVLTTIMSLVTASSFRISRVWKDIRHEKAALNELSNQLDWLTSQPIEQVKDTIESLQPSDECQGCLRKPSISGVVIEQPDFGHRLTISITWQNHSGQRSRPLQLSAWWAEPVDREDSQ